MCPRKDRPVTSGQSVESCLEILEYLAWEDLVHRRNEYFHQNIFDKFPLPKHNFQIERIDKMHQTPSRRFQQIL